MSKRTGAGLLCAAMILTACGGGALAFGDLSRAEQLAFDVFDELDSGLSEPELSCVVRTLDDEGVLLPRDTDDLADFEVNALASSEVEDCAEDPRDLASLIAAVRGFEAEPEDDDPAEGTDEGSDEPADEDPADDPDDEGDDEGEGDEGDEDDGDRSAGAIGPLELLDTEGEPATLTELSPDLLAAAEGSDLSGVETALDMPSELVPSGNIIFYDAQGALSFTDGEITFGSFDLGFFAEDTGDDGQRFIDSITDEEFSIDSETSVTQDGVVTEILEMSRGRDRLTMSIGQGGDFEGVLVVEYSYTDGTGQAARGTGSEHGWVNSISLPESTDVTRVSSGYRPPLVSFFEPRLQLVRSMSANIDDVDVDAFVDAVLDGELLEDVELRVERETGDLEDGLNIELRDSRDQPVRVSLYPSSLDDDDSYRLSVDAPIELPDLDIGSALEDAPEPEDA